MIVLLHDFCVKFVILSAKSMVKGSKGDSSNDPKASTDSSTTLEDDDPKGELPRIRVRLYYIFSKIHHVKVNIKN